jgi:hypothetical protein
VAIGLSIALLAPADAQFFDWGWGGQRRQQPQPQQQQQRQQRQYNPFGNWFGNAPQQRQAPVADYSRAPAPRRPADPDAVTTPILVLGDGMADWLAYGLEDAFSEKPELGVIRKHRTYSGLIRFDSRRDTTWAQEARALIAAEKPKFIIMMIGTHDRQTIREQPAKPAPKRDPQQPAEEAEAATDPDSPESLARKSAEQQNAELRRTAKTATPKAAPKREPPAGPMEFHSERWQAAYIQRIDATIAALKSGGVPVFWVGLPPQRNTRINPDWAYLNELYRARAERAGIVYIDVWDGFVDEAGRYSSQGPDFEGQIRRLRSGDGIYFTRYGARKLAHYVEREIQRSVINRAVPVALPTPELVPQAPGARPGPRPLAGPVVPLTAPFGVTNELLGGGVARPAGSDPIAARVLVRGEPIRAPTGRADNFAWPRDGVPAPAVAVQPEQKPTAPAVASTPAAVEPRAAEPRPSQPKAAPPPAAPKAAPPPKRQPAKNGPPPAAPKRAVQQRTRTNNGEGPPRPPLPITPYAR